MKTDTHIEGSISDEQIQDVDVFDRCSCFGEHRSRREQKGRIAWWVSLIFIIGMYHLCLELFDNYTSFSMIKFENGKRIVPELETYKNLTLFKPFPGKLFRDNETFKSATEDTKDLYWKGLFPRSGGIVSLSSEFVYQAGLPASSPNPNNDGEFVYNLGVFHQLHCLNVLRRALRLKGSTDLEINPSHVEHCLEYLRQGIQCSADMTLLSTVNFEDYGVQPGDRHICRDIESIRLWADQNRYHNYWQKVKDLHPEFFETRKH